MLLCPFKLDFVVQEDSSVLLSQSTLHILLGLLDCPATGSETSFWVCGCPEVLLFSWVSVPDSIPAELQQFWHWSSESPVHSSLGWLHSVVVVSCREFSFSKWPCTPFWLLFSFSTCGRGPSLLWMRFWLLRFCQKVLQSWSSSESRCRPMSMCISKLSSHSASFEKEGLKESRRHRGFTQKARAQNFRAVFVQWYLFSTSISQHRTASGRKAEGHSGGWNSCRKLATFSPKSFARGMKSGSALTLPIILREKTHSEGISFILKFTISFEAFVCAALPRTWWFQRRRYPHVHRSFFLKAKIGGLEHRLHCSFFQIHNVSVMSGADSLTI